MTTTLKVLCVRVYACMCKYLRVLTLWIRASILVQPQSWRDSEVIEESSKKEQPTIEVKLESKENIEEEIFKKRSLRICALFAEKALKHYKLIKGVEYEFVEPVWCNKIFVNGGWNNGGWLYHANFMAKPKIPHFIDPAPKLFFTEYSWIYGQEARVNTCCIVDPNDQDVVSNTDCKACGFETSALIANHDQEVCYWKLKNFKNLIYHPIGRYIQA